MNKCGIVEQTFFFKKNLFVFYLYKFNFIVHCSSKIKEELRILAVLVYKPDSKKVGTLYKLWIKKDCNNLQIS